MDDLAGQKGRELYRAIQQNRFCYVLGLNPTASNPISRSSLQVRTRQRLELISYRCVTVQIHPSFSSQKNLREYAWDKFLISSIWNSLYPTQPLAILQWLKATAKLSSGRRLEHFVRDLLFPELRGKPLIIFIDEVDSLLKIPLALRDFLIQTSLRETSSFGSKLIVLEDRFPLLCG